MVREWSRTVISLLALPIVVTVAAVISSVPSLVIAIFFPLLLVTLLLFLDEKVQLRVSASVSDDIVKVGDEITVDASVSVTRGFGLILFKFPSDPKFDTIDGTNVHLIFKSFGPIEQKYSYKLKALRRGLVDFPEITYSYYPALGLLNKTEEKIPIDREIKILPNIQILRKSQMRTKSKILVPRQSRARLGPYSTEFVTIRDYNVGDPYKFINWKASSRLTNPDKLVVNDYEREGLRTFIFIIDRSDLMKRGTGEENPFEYGIAFILSYSKLLLAYGINVGIWVLPQSARGPTHYHHNYVLPGSGSEHFQRIKELLLAAEPQAEEERKDREKSNMPPFEWRQDSLLIKLVLETKATVIIATNLQENAYPLSRFVHGLLRLNSLVTIVDIMPYSIIAKYSGGIGGGTISLKGLLLPNKKRLYDLIPPQVRIISWDPTTESVGKIVRTSIAISRLPG